MVAPIAPGSRLQTEVIVLPPAVGPLPLAEGSSLETSAWYRKPGFAFMGSKVWGSLLRQALRQTVHPPNLQTAVGIAKDQHNWKKNPARSASYKLDLHSPPSRLAGCPPPILHILSGSSLSSPGRSSSCPFPLPQAANHYNKEAGFSLWFQ